MHYTRRDVLCGAAALAASPLGYQPKIALAFYIWTEHLSARNVSLAAGMREMMAATRRAGYRRVEVFGNFFAPGVREATLAALKEFELELPIVYKTSLLHESAGAGKAIAEALEVADAVKPLGTAIMIVNPNPKPKQERKSDAELGTQARYVNRLGEELKKRGIDLLLHHHSPEMAEDAREWRHLYRNTDPATVSFCIDVDWVERGGQVPLTILRECGHRLRSLHLRNSRNGVWTETFGDGDIDYRPIADYLRQIRFSGYLSIELAYEKGTNPVRSLEEDLRLSRLYTERIFRA